MSALSHLVAYYVNLLIIQYHNQPKAMATIALFAQVITGDEIVLDVENAYSLLSNADVWDPAHEVDVWDPPTGDYWDPPVTVEGAVGLQLDVLGKYEGVNRLYQPALTGFFSTITYSQVESPPDQLGFTNYANFNTDVGDTLTYNDLIGGSQLLSDDNFRILIQLAIIVNNSNFSRQSIDEDIYAIFGSTVIPSSPGNMVMWYFVPPSLSALLLAAFQKGLLPKPMGVLLGGLIEQSATFFGFTTYQGGSPLITGFSTYADYATKIGETLQYGDIII